MVIDKIVVGDMEENCYLAGDPEALLVIDPGAEAERILAHIHENNYQVSSVVLTHCHFDHVGAAAEIIKATGAELLLGALEKDNYFNSEVSFCGRFAPMPELCRPDRLLAEGEVIRSGNFCFQVLETPGHTGGSICLLSEKHLFSGDTLFYRSIGRTDFPTGSLKALVSSVKEKLFTLDDDVKVYPGHGENSEIGYEKEHNEVYAWERFC